MLLQREVAKRGVQLVCRIDGLAPCRFDVEKVKQALLNLVKNALEALPAGGTITVATGRQEDGVTVTVADDGPGIAPADLPLIFEPFFTRKGAGTGLGLSITQRIVQEHHGRINVSSAPGEGTVFTLWFPMNQQKPYGGAA
jgi:signal transduction histidine kinase